MQIEICNQLQQIDPEQWNALVQDNNPFLRHEFLSALETHQCVGEHFGWLPRHIAIYQQDELVAAMPLYEKYNSYGEFVFDNAWANAWHQHGLQYFPKLVSAIPYTPATGQRMLVKSELQQSHYPVLLNVIEQVAEKVDASGAHILFPETEQLQWLQANELMIRHDCQYHWHNQSYQSFDDFLSRLSSRKRKNIVKERQSVKQSGVTLRRLNGYEASDDDWKNMARFYERTFAEKWGTATLNYDFFREVARTMPKQVLLVLAEQNNTCIAGAMLYRSNSRLYGRFWGCDKTVRGLHFEACYYQGIEYCIEHGLKVFEPGAQGEHKIARGFVPTLTRSAHYMRHGHFKEAIAQFIEQEKLNVLSYIDETSKNLPYKNSN